MAELVANLCVNCKTPVGYVTNGALQIPTMCILCVSDKEVMEEWEHQIKDGEQIIDDVLRYYRSKTMERIGFDWSR